jgi:hypothetical protein
VARVWDWHGKRRARRRAERLLDVLEQRAQYLELLSVTTRPGMLLHIVEAIDQTDVELDRLDPEHEIPRGGLVAIPRA